MEETYSVTEFAREMGTTVSNVHKWIRQRAVKAFQLNPLVKGSEWRIPVSEKERIRKLQEKQMKGKG